MSTLASDIRKPIAAQPTAIRKRRRIRRPHWSARVGGFGVAIVIGVAILGPWLAPYDPIEQDIINALKPPSTAHLLGTDELGRDVLSRLLFGARISLLTSTVAVGAALMIGATLGLLAGYFGGRVEHVIMRPMDILLALPGFLLAILVVGALGTGIVNVVVAIGVHSVPQFARLARGVALSVKGQEYVTAAESVGAGAGGILLRHIAPNVTAPVTVQASTRLATAILTAASLSFLGLGVQPPTPEWGAMLSNARSYLRYSPHVAIFPGLALMWTVLSLNLLGDGLRDMLDPRSRS